MKKNANWKQKFMAGAAALLLLAAFSGGAFAATGDAGQYIGEARAKNIALEHANVTEAQATFINAHLDYDDGRVVYDIEFYSGTTEYDYEIDALTGDIREFDYELEYYSISAEGSSSNGTESYIGEAKAKAAALEHAGIAEAQATFINSHLDHDDGRVVYDIEFYSGNTEYDYEIDALSGAVLEYDRDIESYSTPRATQRPRATQKPSSSSSSSSGSYIGTSKAKSIALSNAGLKESEVRGLKAKLDREDGRMIYEVDFKSGRREYEYEIDATSGKILHKESEYDD